MGQPAILVDGVWKKFRRGSRHDSLRDLIPAAARLLMRRPQPALTEQEFWALRDVSFEIGAGEAVAIIGSNGAGKSTLLKLLTRILKPTTGACQVHGRIGALIEVAAGFHPDLSGRENVYLQGAVMGMKRAEISGKFDRIVEFAGVGDFIDTPVKRYSSGMNARLGFSIAAHLDPDVLLVDEVLSVGDAIFQERCVERMRELTKERGIPLVFITHNLPSVLELCTRGIVLDHGTVQFDGAPDAAIRAYRAPAAVARAPRTDAPIWIERVELCDTRGEVSAIYRTGGALNIRVHYRTNGEVPRPHFAFDIHRGDGAYCAGINSQMDGVQGGPLNGAGVIELGVRNLSLLPGAYSISVGILDPVLLRPIDLHAQAYPFSIVSDHRDFGLVRLEREWKQEHRGVAVVREPSAVGV